MEIKTTIVSYHTADSKPVKQEVNGTVILPPLVFRDLYDARVFMLLLTHPRFVFLTTRKKELRNLKSMAQRVF